MKYFATMLVKVEYDRDASVFSAQKQKIGQWVLRKITSPNPASQAVSKYWQLERLAVQCNYMYSTSRLSNRATQYTLSPHATSSTLMQC